MIDPVERVDALRLSHADQQQILHQLDAAAHQRVIAELRASRRYRYVVREGLVLQVEGARVQFVVRPRNLSAGGIAVLHGSFLYPGTPCAIMLRELHGEQTLVEGRIVHCRCVHGRAHEVHIRFGEPIEIERFVDLRQARVVTAEDVASAPGARTYPSAQVAQLARRLEELARAQAQREELYPLVMQLAALLNPS